MVNGQFRCFSAGFEVDRHASTFRAVSLVAHVHHQRSLTLHPFVRSRVDRTPRFHTQNHSMIFERLTFSSTSHAIGSGKASSACSHHDDMRHR